MLNRDQVDTKAFLDEQLKSWPLAAKNFADLNDITMQEMTIDGNLFRVQYNPHRMVSSGAKVDTKSIEQRPCFLCENNRPKEQIKMTLANDMTLLVNPFPIFPAHFTIPTNTHIPQLLSPHLEDGLQLATNFPELLFFYNGAKCGASAPDHFHFQAGNRGFLPIEEAIKGNTIKSTIIAESANKTIIKSVKDSIRNYLIFSGSNHKELTEIVQKTLVYQQENKNEESPCNVLFWADNGLITIVYIPRSKHRPWQYSGEGDSNVLFSPAAVEMGGVAIFARQDDFNKIDETLLKNMLLQVTYPDTKFDALCTEIKKIF